MSTKTLLITELTPKAGAIQRVASAWAALPQSKGVIQRAVYEAVDGSSVLELSALDSTGDTSALESGGTLARDKLAPDLASDFRRQLLTFVEAPKDTPYALPATPYVQLRHVEVPPDLPPITQCFKRRFGALAGAVKFR